MAEAALRIDEAAAASQLRRSRVAARRQGGPRRKRGQVLPFRQTEGTPAPPTPRAYGSALVSEEELYNIPRSPEEEAANNLERLQKEQARKAQLQRIKAATQQNLKNFINPPKEISELAPDVTESDEFLEAQEEFEQQSLASLQRFRSQEQSKIQTARQLARTAKEFTEKAKKIRDAIKKAKEALDAAWTAGRTASVAESEGMLAWLASGSGVLAAMYSAGKAVILPNAQVSNDPDAGQFFKGLLSFIEPPVTYARRITGWVTGIHAIVGYFFAFIILMVIMIAIMFAGFGLYFVSDVASYLQ